MNLLIHPSRAWTIVVAASVSAEIVSLNSSAKIPKMTIGIYCQRIIFLGMLICLSLWVQQVQSLGVSYFAIFSGHYVQLSEPIVWEDALPAHIIVQHTLANIVRDALRTAEK